MRQFLFLMMLFVGPLACGEKPPELVDLDGRSHALDEYIGRGHWVMVNVWSPGCSHCVVELPALTEFHRDNAVGATVLGIAVDYPGFGYPDAAAVRQFSVDHEVNFPVLLADGPQATSYLDDVVDLVPLTLAYNPRGESVARWHGVITRRDIEEIIQEFTVAAP